MVYLICRSSIFILVLTLWIQWPFRSFFGFDARLVNDIGQIAFAYFVVTAFADANRNQSHLRIYFDNSIHKQSDKFEWMKYLFIAPWALFVIYSAWPIFLNSISENEKFPDSYTSGFYLIKLALLFLPLSFLYLVIQKLKKAIRDKF
jgi:TRAP-type mannitol/chloroaromatic compound transport system permease small subunit